MCRAIVENMFSGTKAGFKATRNLVFNQKAERSTMNRQKSRRIVENVLSRTKAGFKSILNLVFNQKKERKKMDHQKSKSTFSAILPALTLMVAAFGVFPSAGMAKKMAWDPSIKKMVEAPRHGGTLTLVKKSEHATFDGWIGGVAGAETTGVVEKLGISNWAEPRDSFPTSGYMLPLYAIRGALAEGWEQTDPLTYVFYIRKGVHFHNKAPVNGRELTAKDIEWNYHRYLGSGSGFSKPSPGAGQFGELPWESIMATDKYTVVFKLKEPSLNAPIIIMDWYNLFIYPPETIKQHGEGEGKVLKDWRHLAGTGPFEMTNRIDGVSVTFTKNPNYWSMDEKFPQNHLPYLDGFQVRFIPEPASYLAALRTGKIDLIGWQGQSYINSVDQMESLKKTNPELLFYEYIERSNHAFGVNTSKAPFNDIRVRKAMQMALDLETIKNTYYKGYGDTTPRGMYGLEFTGYYVPFEEWPEEVKQAHTYDPEGAKKLLAEAGYPDGFKTEFVYIARYDASYAELAAEYWRQIGIDARINIKPFTDFIAARDAGNFGIIGNIAGVRADPMTQIDNYHSKGPWNSSKVNDPEYDAAADAAKAATNFEDQQKFLREADYLVVTKFYHIWGPMFPSWQVHQPWVKGFNGEAGLGGMQNFTVFARLWIDQELKKEMGH